MGYKFIDMDSFPRRSHFEHFYNMASPAVGLTVNMDITSFKKEVKEKGLPFFHTLVYRAVWAMNSVPQLRQRIREGKIVEYDFCDGTYTLALPDETYCYCHLEFNKPFEEFIPYAEKVKQNCLANPNIDEEGDPEGYFFISSVPWVSFTAAVQPMAIPADSNPRLLFGKYFTEGERLLIPVCIQSHHALTDGLHLSKFYLKLQKLLDGEE